jgi:hypothetical protein
MVLMCFIDPQLALFLLPIGIFWRVVYPVGQAMALGHQPLLVWLSSPGMLDFLPHYTLNCH